MSDLVGTYVLATVGSLEIERCQMVMHSVRGAVDQLQLTVPDPLAELYGEVAAGQDVAIEFGYRGGAKHEWAGVVQRAVPVKDALIIECHGPERALLTTTVTESYNDETSAAIAKKLIEAAGLKAGTIDIPDEPMNHLVFSAQPVRAALLQLLSSLEHSFGHNMSGVAIWAGSDGAVNISAAGASGDTWLIDDENIIVHHPDGLWLPPKVEASLLPGLAHSMPLHIVDLRRGIDLQAMVQSVVHRLGSVARTTISYQVQP